MKTVIVETSCGHRFRLNADQMVEVKPEYSPYTALRIDLRAAWLSPEEVKLPYVFPHVDGGRATELTKIEIYPNMVRIGCMTFCNENFLKLKAWALRGR